MYSKQETFNRVAEHLLTQSRRSTSATGSCLYRDGQGGSCAAGCLLTDRTYRKRLMEGRTVDEVLLRLKREDWFGHNAKLVGDLQDVHDDRFLDEWKSELAAVAEEHGLDASILKQFRGRGEKYTRITESQ